MIGKEIRSVMDYWECMNEIDRGSLMESLYINPELGQKEFKELPQHVRSMLYALWDHKWKYLKHELEF